MEGIELTKKTIVLVSTLDTKGSEAAFLKGLIQERGHRVILLDTNTGGEATISPDISAKEVAKAAGWNIEEIKKMKDTGKASSIMIEGAIKKVKSLLDKRRTRRDSFFRRCHQYRDGHNHYEVSPLWDSQGHALQHSCHACLCWRIFWYQRYRHDPFCGGHCRI